MLKLLQALFGKKTVDQVEPTVEASTPKTLEFHEEIKAQVEAEAKKEKKPAVKAKSNKGKKAPAKITAEKKAPAKKKPAPKKSK